MLSSCHRPENAYPGDHVDRAFHPKQGLVNEAGYRQLLIDIAKAPYLLIPVDKYDVNNFPTMLKWLDKQRPDMNYQAGSRNFHRMRLAETYLIAGEAYGRKGEWDKALEMINEVRKRAAYAEGEQKPSQVYRIDGGENNGNSTVEPMLVTETAVHQPKFPSGSGFDPFVDWMLEERARELYGELCSGGLRRITVEHLIPILTFLNNFSIL